MTCSPSSEGRDAQIAASAHQDDEWNITYEHVNPQDPLIAAPRWRDALRDIAGREWRDEGGRIAAAIARDALGGKSDA